MAKPAVDRLETTLSEQQIALVRLNVMDELGRSLASRYAVRGVPTLIVLDRQGEPVLRQIGRIQPESVLESVATLN